MMTGFRGTFVISWSQTELDGLAAASVGSLFVGALWQWHGEATRIDGPTEVLVLGQSEEATRLRQHAARAVRRLVYVALEKTPHATIPDPDAPVLDCGFAVTDGLRSYTATLVEIPGRDVPLLMFLDQMPPCGQDLWVTHVTEQTLHANRSGDAVPEVICFTPDTRIATPDGPRLVAELCEDDLILTKDDGPQAVRWIGQRRMSGARLYAMPELRPIRISAGAVGMDVPDADLLVSPQHRMLLKGPMAQTLFNTSEVLVAAKDLINDRTIAVDRHVRSVTYVHLLLDRHQIVFANGLESESFHPASMPLHAIAPEQQQSLLDRVPGLDRDGSAYGAYARRALTSAEAAIMQYKV
ncbi:MAG: Hint domain-containing protein [Rhodobacter sp.]|nr:Hint domain-containing protein [Rhodobacter sp.]